MDAALLNRYLHQYGSNVELLLADCIDMHSLGTKYGASLYQVELDYLLSEEWAEDYDDILMRRTKLGLEMDEVEKGRLAEYLEKIKAENLSM